MAQPGRLAELDVRIEQDVRDLAGMLGERGWMLCTAESCTGGLIAASCTELAGSSLWFERGFVTYSNESKVELLGVPAELIAQHGAVSAEVARAMALGALARSRAQVAVAVTGIAGPGGAVPGKPVGTVWLAWAGAAGGATVAGTRLLRLQGSRSLIRQHTVIEALQAARALCSELSASPGLPSAPGPA